MVQIQLMEAQKETSDLLTPADERHCRPQCTVALELASRKWLRL